MKKYLIRILFILVIVLTGVPVYSLSQAQESTQGVQPPAGPPATEFFFFATGFDDKEKLGYWFVDPAGNVYSDDHNYRIRAYQGRVDWSWRVPHSAPVGTWRAVIKGISSKVERVIEFEVIGYDPEAVTNADNIATEVLDQGVEPPVGPPGTYFSFYAFGFKQSEDVAYWFAAPDGTTITPEPENFVHTQEGRVDWFFQSPANAMPGMWSTAVKGLESGVERIIHFEIELLPGMAAPVVDENGPQRSTETAVSPLVSRGGTKFNFFARGFDHREKVGYWFNAPDGTIYQDRYTFVVLANQDRADWGWTPPDDAMPGIWSAVAKGTVSHVERVIEFEIGDPSNPTIGLRQGNQPGAAGGGAGTFQNDADVAVEPLMGAPGSRFAFSAGGFPRREIIYFWATDPHGTTYEKSKYQIRSNEEGVAYWDWEVPEDGISGVWTMAARGDKSMVKRVIYFEVRDPNASQQQAVVNVPPPDQILDLPHGVNSPHVSLEPLIAPAGSRFNFSAKGYEYRASVFFWAVDPNGKEYTNEEKYKIRANEEGTAYWNWKTPEDAVDGVWEMHAKHNISDFEHVIYFEVGDPTKDPAVSFYSPQPVAQPATQPASQPGAVAAPQPAAAQPAQSSTLPTNSPDVAVDPLSGPPGARFNFSAAGFPSREKVTFWAVDPTGLEYKKEKYVIVSNEQGVAYWNWKTPPESLPGIWTMYAVGDKSMLQHTIFFEVSDPNAPQGSSVSVAQPAAPTEGVPAEQMQSATPVGPEANSADVAVDPVADVPGSRFAFYALGYPERETVYYWAIAPDGTKYENVKYDTISNLEGRADWTWKVPDDAMPGIWQMHARGDKSFVEHVIYFEVIDTSLPPSAVRDTGTTTQPATQPAGPSSPQPVPPAAPAPATSGLQTAVDPPVGYPGERFSFYATGFPAREKVYYWAIAPDGTEYRKWKYEVVTNEEGRADWNWLTPDDAMPGVWKMYAQGDTASLTHEIPFEILP